jgi:type III secretion protein J
MKNKNYRSFHLPFLVGILLLSVVACARIQIYQDLTENDANEILVALQDRGIEAQKVKEEKSQQVSWSVQVAQKDAATARKILVENNLPRKKQLGISGICKEKGLIPTPEEEKCRKILAMKGEIINSLERIPGVIDADVVLNIPDISEFSTETQSSKRPTASAVLRVRKTPEGLELTEPKIQRYISNTVENLDPRDVSAVIAYVQPPEEIAKQASTKKMASMGNLVSIAGLKMDVSSKDTFKVYSLTILILLLAISGALVFSLLRMTKLRQQLKFAQTGEVVSAPISGEHEAKLIQGPEGEGEGMTPQIPAAGHTVPKG